MIFSNFLMKVKKVIVEFFYPKITGKQLERLLIKNNRNYSAYFAPSNIIIRHVHDIWAQSYIIIRHAYAISLETKTKCYHSVLPCITVKISKKGSKYMISDNGILETQRSGTSLGSYIYCFFTKDPKNLMMYVDKMVGFIMWEKTGPRKRHDLGAYEDVKLIKQ